MLYTPVETEDIEKTSENPGKSRKTSKRKCYIIYNIFVSLVLTPGLPIAMWRGTWNLMDTYDEYFRPIPCFLTGQVIIIILEIWKRYYGDAITPLKSDPKCDVIIKSIGGDIFTHMYNIGSIMFWRILWECMNVDRRKLSLKNPRNLQIYF